MIEANSTNISQSNYSKFSNYVIKLQFTSILSHTEVKKIPSVSSALVKFLPIVYCPRHTFLLWEMHFNGLITPLNSLPLPSEPSSICHPSLPNAQGFLCPDTLQCFSTILAANTWCLAISRPQLGTSPESTSA